MAAKKIAFDVDVFLVIIRRHKLLLCSVTVISIFFSGIIASKMIRAYEASILLSVEQGDVLKEIAGERFISTSLTDQLATLRYQILNKDFLEPFLVNELNLHKEDVYVPPGGLHFIEKILMFLDWGKDFGKQLLALDVYERSKAFHEKEVVDILKKNIKIELSKSRFVKISFAGPNAIHSRDIVKIVVNRCKELLLRRKTQETLEASKYITQQYREITDTLRGLEKQLATLKVAMFDKTPEAKIALSQQLEKTLDLRDEAQQELATLTMKTQELIHAREKRQTELRHDPEIIAQLAVIAQNQEAIELKTLKTRLNELQTIYTNEYPEVKQLEQEIARRESLIQSTVHNDKETEEKTFLADTAYNEYARQITRIESEQVALQAQEKKFIARIEKYEKKLKAMPEAEKSFDEIERQIKLYEKLQFDFAEKLEVARATRDLDRLRRENRIQVVVKRFSSEPSGPSSLAIVGLLSLIGPGIAVSLIFLSYARKNPVKNSEDVREEYNLPVIAVIPGISLKKTAIRYKKWLNRVLPLRKAVRQMTSVRRMVTPEPATLAARSEQDFHQKCTDMSIELFDNTVKRFPLTESAISDHASPVMLFSDPNSQIAEEYRKLCFNVTWGLKESLSDSCKTLMVASALPAEGKTITAMNLAAMLARNHHVLLVDLNFRAPAIEKAFGILRTTGFADMLENDIMPHLYFPEKLPNLHIFPAGSNTINPADLLSDNRMEHIIDVMKNSSYFEYIIFDAPAMTLFPDASIIAPKLDGLIWVVKEMKTAKDMVHAALKSLKNPKILGVVLQEGR